MTLSAPAKIELIETALANGKYRTLQKSLRELRDAQQIILQRYLSDSHESLKAEAQRIIESLKQTAETQDKMEAVEQETDNVLNSLSADSITNDSDFMQESAISNNQVNSYPVPEEDINFFDLPREGYFHFNGRSSWDSCDVMGTLKESEAESPVYLVYGLGEYHLVEEVSFAVTYPVGYLKNGRIR